METPRLEKLRKCRSCRKEFYVTKLTRGVCSESCKEKRKIVLNKKDFFKKKKSCLSCKNQFEYYGQFTKNPFCTPCKNTFASRKKWERTREQWINLDPMLKSSIRFMVLKRCHFRCVACGHDIKSHLEIDHIIPIRKKPDLLTEITNLQILCFDCNEDKGVQENEAWLKKRKEHINKMGQSHFRRSVIGKSFR
jgi:hypothetical protein